MKNTIVSLAILALLPFVSFADSTVTATADSGSSVTPSGTVVVPTGVTQTFSIAADSGYQIADVELDGTSVGTPSSVDFTGIDADTVDHTLDVSSQALVVAPTSGGDELPYCSGPMAPGWHVDEAGGGCGSSETYEPASSGLCPWIDTQGCMVTNK